MRGDQRLTKDLIKSTSRRVQRKCGFLSSRFSRSFQPFSPGISIVLDPRRRLGVCAKVGSACEEFENNEGLVSKSSGAGSPQWFSWIKSR